MKRFAILFFCLMLFCCQVHARGHRHKNFDEPQTEAELMEKVLQCLRNKDTVAYFNMFPPFDTLWKMVLHNPDQSPETQHELSILKEHPTVLIDLDPFYNKTIVGNFVKVLRKGEDSGVQWQGVVIQRYELQKQGLTPAMKGLQHVAPERFKGYLFVRDKMSSTTFCITMKEIQNVNGVFCGGQVLNVLEAKDIDQYIAKEQVEEKALMRKKWLAEHEIADSVVEKKDTVAKDTSIFAANYTPPTAPMDSLKKNNKKLLLLMGSTSVEEDSIRTRREVVDRRYYKGKFDEEIPVELYVRYMRDIKNKVTKYWDALYKFGDMSEYVKLDVSMTPDEKWLFEEPVASMELELAGKLYSGSWTNGQNQTGYDAELSQKEISDKKIQELDKILDNGTWGKTDEQKIVEKRDTTEKHAAVKSGGTKEPKEKKLSRK